MTQKNDKQIVFSVLIYLMRSRALPHSEHHRELDDERLGKWATAPLSEVYGWGKLDRNALKADLAIVKHLKDRDAVAVFLEDEVVPRVVAERGETFAAFYLLQMARTNGSYKIRKAILESSLFIKVIIEPLKAAAGWTAVHEANKASYFKEFERVRQKRRLYKIGAAGVMLLAFGYGLNELKKKV